VAAAGEHGAVHLDSGSDLFFAKDRLVLFLFLWVRATFQRFRYDQLMRLGWKVFCPCRCSGSGDRRVLMASDGCHDQRVMP